MGTCLFCTPALPLIPVTELPLSGMANTTAPRFSGSGGKPAPTRVQPSGPVPRQQQDATVAQSQQQQGPRPNLRQTQGPAAARPDVQKRGGFPPPPRMPGSSEQPPVTAVASQLTDPVSNQSLPRTDTSQARSKRYSSQRQRQAPDAAGYPEGAVPEGGSEDRQHAPATVTTVSMTTGGIPNPRAPFYGPSMPTISLQ